MRKLVMGAVAASATLAVAAAAVAQAPAEGTFTAKVSPSKAGTKKKPKGATTTFTTDVATPNTTVETIELRLPKTLKFSGKGFKKCDFQDLEAFGPKDPRGCSKASSAGPRGEAHALVGSASDPAKTPFDFNVYPFVEDANTFLIYLEQYIAPDRDNPVGVQQPIRGEITGNGRKLTITIPQNLRTPGGIDASLVELEQAFNGKAGRGKKAKYIVSSTGCKNKKYTMNSTLKFSDRVDGTPTPPALTMKASASCKK